MGITIDVWKLLSSIVLIVLIWKGFWLILGGIGWVFQLIKDLVNRGKEAMFNRLGLHRDDDDDEDDD